MAFKTKPKKDLKKGAKESDSGKAGSEGALTGAEKGRLGSIGDFLHKIAGRMAAGRNAGTHGPEFPQAVPPKGPEERAANNGSTQPEKKSSVREVSIDDLTEDITRAGEALKKKDLKTAEALYWSISETYNQMASDPKCNVKAAKAAYDKLASIYAGIVKLRGGSEENIVFKPLNEAMELEKKEVGAAQAGGEGAKQGDSNKLPQDGAVKKRLHEEQIIYTAIDSIIEIVDSKGEISLQDLSKILNLSPEQMEELAKILDEHGILQLHYPSNPLAHPLLRSISKHDFKRLGRSD